MAFTVPAMPLAVNIWRHGTGVTNPPDVVTVGNLTPGTRDAHTETTPPALMFLLLPARTDIRALLSAGSQDFVEVPAGTGRHYIVFFVDDVARGFANEYRRAELKQDLSATCGLPWPQPLT
jgi:hypothetical protein